jgi:hypothetical protein
LVGWLVGWLVIDYFAAVAVFLVFLLATSLLQSACILYRGSAAYERNTSSNADEIFNIVFRSTLNLKH